MGSVRFSVSRANGPSPEADNGLADAVDERRLGTRWRDRHDIAAGQRLAADHLHLIGDVASTYRGLDVSWNDLIGEGYVGLMRALCRFDPDAGVSFTAFAGDWVRAAVETYVMRELWSPELAEGASVDASYIS